MESAANRLQKEAKGYLDSLRGEDELKTTPDFEPELTASQAMTASQMRIAETIDAFYGDAGTRDGVSRSYKQAVEDLDAETIKALDGPYRYVRLPITSNCGMLTVLSEPQSSNRSLDFAPTSPISMNASRNETINYSITTPCDQRSRSWWRNQTKM